ncbi:thioredoxin family protein [Acidiplasma cupricumulans]|uniref:Thioredoxin-like fold domain-containing protein n=1 Tax=Acidiplasma cupricumulans TaxID=312540 RepID=A0A0Q0RS55_9ARCH|nr:thioredoxin family protein [Acidiplasma cupricumulans]KQB35201.1 hypothetical protein AOG55_00570 [Acidiplasma cupricumulans]
MYAYIFLNNDEKSNQLEEYVKRFDLRILKRDNRSDEYKNLKIALEPAVAFTLEKGNTFVYYGIPEGKENEAFKKIIYYIVTGTTNLIPNTKNCIANVNTQTNLKLFVTPECPYCKRMGELLGEFVVLNKNINLSIVNVFNFPEIIEKYDIEAVPTLIINEEYKLIGFHEESLLCMHILSSLNKLYE